MGEGMWYAFTTSTQKDSSFVHSYQTTKQILLLIQMIQRSSFSKNRADFRFKQELVRPELSVPAS